MNRSTAGGSPQENGEEQAGETDQTTVAGTLVIAPRAIEDVLLDSWAPCHAKTIH